MAKLKKVGGVYEPGSTHWVGDGFPVRNLFPSNGVDANPFLMLDYAGPRQFEPSERRHGVRQHPHRGFETVTIAFQGSINHRDSAGNSGVIHPGDVQWMTAGSGVVHEEMHGDELSREGGMFEVVQLWVNLPRAEKMTPPAYQELKSDRIPVVKLGAASTARVIAGELNGARGPARTHTPVNVFDVRLEKGDEVHLALPEGNSAALVLRKGNVLVNGETVLEGEARIATLSLDGGEVTLQPAEATTLLVLSGEPIREPVASYGPFVMNTEEELEQAVSEYRSGKMGFLS